MEALYETLNKCVKQQKRLDESQIKHVCSFIKENINVEDDNGSALCSETDAFRLLLQMVLFARSAPVMEPIQKLFAVVVMRSAQQIEEFLLLGQSLASILPLISQSLSRRICSLRLPFIDPDSRSVTPLKYTLRIESHAAALELQNFWCTVLVNLYKSYVVRDLCSTCPSTSSSSAMPLSDAAIAQIVCSMMNHNASMNVSPQFIFPLCSAVDSRLHQFMESPRDMAFVEDIFSGGFAGSMMSWLESVVATLIERVDESNPGNHVEQIVLAVKCCSTLLDRLINRFGSEAEAFVLHTLHALASSLGRLANACECNIVYRPPGVHCSTFPDTCAVNGLDLHQLVANSFFEDVGKIRNGNRRGIPMIADALCNLMMLFRTAIIIARARSLPFSARTGASLHCGLLALGRCCIDLTTHHTICLIFLEILTFDPVSCKVFLDFVISMQPQPSSREMISRKRRRQLQDQQQQERGDNAQRLLHVGECNLEITTSPMLAESQAPMPPYKASESSFDNDNTMANVENLVVGIINSFPIDRDKYFRCNSEQNMPQDERKDYSTWPELLQRMLVFEAVFVASLASCDAGNVNEFKVIMNDYMNGFEDALCAQTSLAPESEKLGIATCFILSLYRLLSICETGAFLNALPTKVIEQLLPMTLKILMKSDRNVKNPPDFYVHSYQSPGKLACETSWGKKSLVEIWPVFLCIAYDLKSYECSASIDGSGQGSRLKRKVRDDKTYSSNSFQSDAEDTKHFQLLQKLNQEIEELQLEHMSLCCSNLYFSILGGDLGAYRLSLDAATELVSRLLEFRKKMLHRISTSGGEAERSCALICPEFRSFAVYSLAVIASIAQRQDDRILFFEFTTNVTNVTLIGATTDNIDGQIHTTRWMQICHACPEVATNMRLFRSIVQQWKVAHGIITSSMSDFVNHASLYHFCSAVAKLLCSYSTEFEHMISYFNATAEKFASSDSRLSKDSSCHGTDDSSDVFFDQPNDNCMTPKSSSNHVLGGLLSSNPMMDQRFILQFIDVGQVIVGLITILRYVDETRPPSSTTSWTEPLRIVWEKMELCTRAMLLDYKLRDVQTYTKLGRLFAQICSEYPASTFEKARDIVATSTTFEESHQSGDRHSGGAVDILSAIPLSISLVAVCILALRGSDLLSKQGVKKLNAAAAIVGSWRYIQSAAPLNQQSAILMFAELCKTFCSNVYHTPLLAELFVAELVEASKRNVLVSLLLEREKEVVTAMLLPLLMRMKIDRRGFHEETHIYDPAAIEELLSVIDRAMAMQISGIRYTRRLSGLFYCNILLWHWHNSNESNANARNSSVILTTSAVQNALEFIRDGKVDLLTPTLSEDYTVLESIPNLTVYLLFAKNDYIQIFSNGGNAGASVLEAAEKTLTDWLVVGRERRTEVEKRSFSRLSYLSTLRTLVWELGSESADSGSEYFTTAVDALQCFCQFTFDRSYCANASEDPMAMLLSQEIYSIMSNLLLRDWDSQTQRYQQRSLRCFRVLIGLVSQSDLLRFLSKVMVVVDSALSTSGRPKVQLAAVDLTIALFEILPKEALRDNLSSLLVGLYPLLELSRLSDLETSDGSPARSHDAQVWKEEAEVELQNAFYDVDFFRSFYPGCKALSEQNKNDESSCTAVSKLMDYKCSVAFASALCRSAVDDAVQKSIGLIQGLFSSESQELKSIAPSMISIPDSVEQLRKVREVHEREIAAYTVDQMLLYLCKMLNHTAANVRLSALNRINKVCELNRVELNKLIEAAAEDGMVVSSTSSELNGGSDDAKQSTAPLLMPHSAPNRVLSDLLSNLLKLCARESIPSVLSACAKCLGQIGAIDPARVKVHSESLAGEARYSSTDKVLRSVNTSGSYGYLHAIEHAPWLMSSEQLSFHLLQKHLVPGLLSAVGTKSQDKSGYAIQEILRHLSSLYEESLEGLNKRKERGKLRASDKIVPVAIENTDRVVVAAGEKVMPEELRSRLISSSIFEIVEPFWNTTYQLNENYPVRQPPIYHAGIDFQRWVSLFTRYLIFKCSGRGLQRSSVFMAVRSFVRTHTDVCEFLLPHLLIDVFTDHETSKELDPELTFAKVVEEICLVLGQCSKNMIGSDVIGAAMAANRTMNGSLLLSSRTNSSGSKGGNQFSSDYRCVQSVFTLLDTLSSWITANNQKILRIQRASNVSNAVLAKAQKELIPCSDHLHRLVEAIPKELLVKAAISVKANTRALKYFEIHARELHRQRRVVYTKSLSTETCLTTSEEDGNATPEQQKIALSAAERMRTGYEDAIGFNELSLNAQATDTHADEPRLESSSTILGRNSNDRALGERPYLTADQVNYLISINSSLEATDAVQGALTLNFIYNHPTTTWHRVQEMELTNDWMSALLEYGLVHKNSSLSALTDTPAVSSARNCFEVERRKMRCMIELGHYESVLEQVNGLERSAHNLQKEILPYGIEAAWRLMSWDNLQSYLDKFEMRPSAGGAADETIDAAPATILNPYEDISYSVNSNDRFKVMVGKLCLLLQKRDQLAFQKELERARMETICSLSAASMESYSRAYPILIQLHIIHDISTAFVEHCDSMENSDSSVPGYFNWAARLSFTAPSLSQRSAIMAVHRCLLGINKQKSLVAENWMNLSTSLRLQGKLDPALIALRNAESLGLSEETVLLNECKILRDSHQINRALMLLEPVETDPHIIFTALKHMNQQSKRVSRSSATDSHDDEQLQINSLTTVLETEDRRRMLSMRLYLATKLMVESKQKQGSGIIDRYKAVIALDNSWAQAHLDLAKYYEFLYSDANNKLHGSNGNRSSGGGNQQSGTTGGRNSSLSLLSNISQQRDFNAIYSFALYALQSYIRCLVVGPELAMQVLPRMLTLWLAFTSAPTGAEAIGRHIGSTLVPGVGGNDSVAVLATYVSKINSIMQTACEDIPASTWYPCFAQLVSRVLHRNAETVDVLCSIILKILAAFPKQGVWLTASLMFSLNEGRKRIAKKLLQDTYSLIVDRSKDDALMLVDAQIFFRNLCELAAHQCNERKIRWTINPEVHLQLFLVPTQRALLNVDALKMLDMQQITANSNTAASSSRGKNKKRGDEKVTKQLTRSLSSTSRGNHYAYEHMLISSFYETVSVAASKAKPKTITLMTICGRKVRFLCKQEKDGDLRKDARLMEFNSAVNRLLHEAAEGSSRQLRLRTYAVVCLNEECGVLEWVESTDCLRSLIHTAHSFSPQNYPLPSHKEIFAPFQDLQTKHSDDLPGMVQKYTQLLRTLNYRPYFHRWFLEHFPDPTEWLAARTIFVRSAAVWSAVGHVIGLGDRHTENILMDVRSGECVHVDFDCLFDKGVMLARPEIIPFRLSPNMVDAMGVTGVEGCFRRTLEVALSVLRDNKDTLTSILEPFLRDPTVAWSRGGRAQRANSSTRSSASNSNARGRNSAGGAAAAVAAAAQQFDDRENEEATAMMNRIRQRLDGIFNIFHPLRDKLIRGAVRKYGTAENSGDQNVETSQQISSKAKLQRGIGVSKEEMLPLSVPGQAQRLIEEATIIENMAQLYVGWQPWL